MATDKNGWISVMEKAAEKQVEILGWKNDGTAEGADIKKAFIAGVQWKQSLIEKLWYHFREVVFAANRMGDNYSEGDEKVKRSLRTNLYTKAAAAREYYEDNKPEHPDEDEYNQVRY